MDEALLWNDTGLLVFVTPLRCRATYDTMNCTAGSSASQSSFANTISPKARLQVDPKHQREDARTFSLRSPSLSSVWGDLHCIRSCFSNIMVGRLTRQQYRPIAW